MGRGGPEHRARHRGALFDGPPEPTVARLVLVGTTSTTYDHFVATLHALLPRFREDLASVGQPDLPMRVWTSNGKTCSTEIARGLPGITFWVMPAAKLKEATRKHPDVTVAVCVADEAIEREQGKFARSAILKWMLLQATPQALTQATMGNKSWLKDFFGGTLLPPRTIQSLVRRSNFTAAQTAAEQLCQLDLVTMAAYRDRIRDDLRALVPRGLAIHTLLARRVTLASQVLRNSVDMVPLSFPRVLEHFLAPCGLDGMQRAMLRSTCEREGLTPAALVAFLDGLCVPRSRESVVRLRERLQEFGEQCPICFAAAPGRMRVYGCCGYCVCEGCYAACNLRCAFCRTPVPRVAPPPEEPAAPAPPMPAPPATRLATLAAQLAAHTTPAATQDVNLVGALQCLVAHGHARILVVVEKPSFSMDALRISPEEIGAAAGVQLTRVDYLLRGKGSQFAEVKRRFDAPGPEPRGMICYGEEEGMLVGTDLAHVDAVVAVGDISRHVLTQALGRVFRPRRSRDNSRLVAMVRIRVPH